MMRILFAILMIGMLSAGCAQAKTLAPEAEGTACTMDAKICPDGSAVSRQGPECEFAPCPGESANKDFPIGDAEDGEYDHVAPDEDKEWH